MDNNCMLYKMRRKMQAIAADILPQEFMCKLYSQIVLKKDVDLKQPKTFNEKLQWLKIHDYPNNKLVVQCADKCAVRNYVKQKGLEKLLVPFYGVWNKAEDIEWEALPDKFVLKCNHGCGYNILCHNKQEFDKKTAIKKLNGWLKDDFGKYNIEPHYSKITPRLISCEEYLGACIMDYKFFCFNGEPKFIYVSNDLIHDRQAQIGFFNLDGSKLLFIRDDYADIDAVEFPPFFDEMLEAAKILAEDFKFVRVDFFLANDRFYFSELTFTPAAGMMPFNPKEYDEQWGKMLKL